MQNPSAVIFQSNEPFTSTENDGFIEVNVESIRTFDLLNIQDVVSHQINKAFNSTSHFIKFINDGEVRISYSADGELLDFWAVRVNVELDDGRVIIKRLSI